MDELNAINKKIDSIELTDFERESLIPMIIDRTRFFLDSLQKLLPLCDNQDTALLIDAAVRQVVANPQIDQAAQAPKAGQAYLAEAKANIQTYWITELSKFLEEFPDSSVIKNRKQLFRMTQKAQQLAGSITWCKTRLLSYSLRSFPIIINKRTGEGVSGPPNEIEIIIYPFLGVLNEMESSASSLIETLKEWGRSKREERKEYISYLTSFQQLRLAKVLNWFQILVIVFTVVLTLASGKLVDLAKVAVEYVLRSIH